MISHPGASGNGIKRRETINTDRSTTTGNPQPVLQQLQFLILDLERSQDAQCNLQIPLHRKKFGISTVALYAY